MSEQRESYYASKAISMSAPAQIVTPLTLTEIDEINLIRRWRQAKAQGLSFVCNTDSGELQMLGRVERLRHSIAY